MYLSRSKTCCPRPQGNGSFGLTTRAILPSQTAERRGSGWSRQVQARSCNWKTSPELPKSYPETLQRACQWPSSSARVSEQRSPDSPVWTNCAALRRCQWWSCWWRQVDRRLGIDIKGTFQRNSSHLMRNVEDKFSSATVRHWIPWRTGRQRTRYLSSVSVHLFSIAGHSNNKFQDFVGIVADYLLYANRSVVQKEEQINHYSTVCIDHFCPIARVGLF